VRVERVESDTEMKIGAILAIDEDNGIGKDGKMAWHIPEDFKHFKNYTKNSLCIMGSVTYLDIVSHKRTNTGELLPERECIVLTTRPERFRDMCPFTGVHFMSDAELLKDIISLTTRLPYNTPLANYTKVCIIGGRSVYEQFFDIIDELIVTRVKGKYDCDTTMDLTPFTAIAVESALWPLEGTPHHIEFYGFNELGQFNSNPGLHHIL